MFNLSMLWTELSANPVKKPEPIGSEPIGK